MKKLRQIITEIHKRNHRSGVIPSPIHYRFFSNKSSDEVFQNVSEETTADEKPKPLGKNWLNKSDNKEHQEYKPSEYDDGGVGDKIGEHNNFTKEHLGAIRAYAEHHDDDPNKYEPAVEKTHSHQINMSHIKGTPLREELKKVDGGLSSAIRNNKLRHNLVTYSGTSFDPREHVDEHGIMKSPGYISSTHNKHIAKSFADYKARGSKAPRHIIQFHLKAGDNAAYIGDVSPKEDEYETVIHKGQSLRHLGTETYTHKGIQYHIHHFEIAK